MSARKTSAAVSEPTRESLEALLATERLEPHWWSNAPGETYSWHEHGYHKVLFCARGSITFHTDDGDIDLAAGDRWDVPPDTRHAATVGSSGVECVEGWKS